MTTLIAYRSLVDHVATVELTNPPDNFFSVAMLEALAATLEALDADDGCRAVLLCAEGKNFCAGADFSAGGPTDIGDLYRVPPFACSARASHSSPPSRARPSAADSAWP